MSLCLHSHCYLVQILGWDLSSVRYRWDVQVEMSMRQLDVSIWSLKERDTDVRGIWVKSEALGDVPMAGPSGRVIRPQKPLSEVPNCIRKVLSWREGEKRLSRRRTWLILLCTIEGASKIKSEKNPGRLVT